MTTGQIKFKGEDIPNGSMIEFHPKGGGAAATKIWSKYDAAESQYTMQTGEGTDAKSGAPAGDYIMTIKSDVPGAIPDKYGDPATSGLLVTVKSKGNSMPVLELTP